MLGSIALGMALLLIALAFTVVPSIAAGGLLRPARVALYSSMPSGCVETPYAGDGLMLQCARPAASTSLTQHGKPVAKLVPYAEPARRSFFGSMKGTVLKYERPFEPIDGQYDIND